MNHYDVLVIGSGFGGSVTALRLTEKGYRVGVLEQGRRFNDSDFARNTWDLKRYLFAPRLGCYGIQRITAMKNVLVVTGAGVGGGSLVYGNTLYEPPPRFFEDPSWAAITDWEAELRPWFAQAKKMLGVTLYNRITPADRVMQAIAVDLGIPKSWTPTPVAIVLSQRPGSKVEDPYFGGVGPDRNSCLHCGECMTGCRHNAKNSLTKNYLYLAESAGAVIHPLTTVVDVKPLASGGFVVSSCRTDRRGRRHRTTHTADQVVFSAAALGTQRLLHDLRDRGLLPNVSPRLGELTRTNSEAGVTVRTRGDNFDFSQGAAITSSLHLDENTHAEPARYGRGSGAMALGMASLVDPLPGRNRLRLTIREVWRQRRDLRRLLSVRGWSEQTLVIGVMQNHDNSLTTFTRRKRLRRGRVLDTRPGIGAPSPTHLPEANQLARIAARLIDGIPAAGWNDAVNKPISGHFLGGCNIGLTPEQGVVDPYHRLHGHLGLHVIDGSNIAANLGVNPSLTIVALAERAISMWPNKGEVDQRPSAGAAYVPISAITPVLPVVPTGAPAALWTTRAGHTSSIDHPRKDT